MTTLQSVAPGMLREETGSPPSPEWVAASWHGIAREADDIFKVSVEGKKKTGISHPGESHEAEDIDETANLGPNVRQ